MDATPHDTNPDFTTTALPEPPDAGGEHSTPEAESEPEEGSAPPTTLGPPAEGSDAWASQEFGRNLTRLREARSMTQPYLAAMSSVPLDSIRGYESGANRPKSPFLWQLAQALGVMPISIGPGMTRKGIAPIPTDIQLKQKNNRALRLQRLVELVSHGEVTEFAALVKMPVADLYALASTETQLTDAQLDPFFDHLPQVRRGWLMSGEGEALVAGRSSAEPTLAEPVASAAATGVEPAMAAAPAEARPAVQPGAIARPQPILTPTGGPVQFIPLVGGLVAEVATVEGVITQIRFLAGAGGVPGLTSADQLDLLSDVLRQQLPTT